MYITTFYSFKGGVGRTFALVNVGVELALTGRRVLLVDFDLEGPGVDTFSVLRPQQPHPGVVEYVSEFMTSGRPPDVRNHIYEALGIGQRGGRLWIMPAGRGDRQYQERLAGIDWQRLYRDMDGYLFFEDLKAQWAEAYAPDYVLIDSRTGYTDVGGICTRQLPDAVVGLFIPNDQNVGGLARVVAEIRAEADGPQKKAIRLHSVMANVPDLDDEEDILKRRVREARRTLGYEQLAATIHRYDSLALLNQVVFTLERPKSRLTREYKRLKDAIVAHNLEDREGVIRFLRQSMTPWGFQFSIDKEDVEKRLEHILAKYPDDPELLFLIAMLRKYEGRAEDALALLDKSIDAGNHTSEALLERAIIRLQSGKSPGARADVEETLRFTNLSDAEVERAVRILGSVDDTALGSVPETSAVRSLEPRGALRIAVTLTTSRIALEAAVRILTALVDDGRTTASQRRNVRHELSTALIGLGRFVEAKQVIRVTRPAAADFSGIQDAFNYAMAEWGETSKPPQDLFRRVVELHGEKDSSVETANYSQCLAIAFWAIGQREDALRSVADAEARIQRHQQPDFSCWQYLRTAPSDFLADCAEIRRLIEGEEILPRFARPPAPNTTSQESTPRRGRLVTRNPSAT